jgi:hypothetical protein
MIGVQVHLLSQSQPIEREAINTYTKDGLFCVYLRDGTVEKYPLVGIFRIVEKS